MLSQAGVRQGVAGARSRLLSVLTALKCLGITMICAYMSFPLLPFQGKYWKAMEVVFVGLVVLLAVASNRSKPLLQLQDWPCWLFLLGLAAGLVAPVDRVVANQRYGERR